MIRVLLPNLPMTTPLSLRQALRDGLRKISASDTMDLVRDEWKDFTIFVYPVG